MTLAEGRFRAMGTDCHVLVSAQGSVAAELVDLARERVELLEQAWSRFRPDSELSRLNARAGIGPVDASADLMLLVSAMREAWVGTGGLFDPTVLASMRALGYDADFATVAGRAHDVADVTLAAAPGMSDVRIDEGRGTVDLPSGIGLDPGAIGKGLGADVIVEELSAAGATGVLVNLGGDVSLAGLPGDEEWAIGVEDERRAADDPTRLMAVIGLPSGTQRGGIATSTTLKRRWAQGRRHHVIDPRTGTMSTSDLVQVTVVGATAAIAEVTATTALLLPSEQAATWLEDRVPTAYLLTATQEITIGTGSDTKAVIMTAGEA
jgi:FAD:protein FMN transferase